MSKKSFTLIELLVVIALIALVVTIVIVALGEAQARARDAKRQTELDQIRKGLAVYHLDRRGYPTTTDWVSLEDETDPEALKVRNDLKPNYLSEIPRDPLYTPEADYSYKYIATTTNNYNLCAKREQGGDEPYYCLSSSGGSETFAQLPGGGGEVILSMEVIHSPGWDDMLPGDTATDTIRLTNTGSIPANSVYMELNIADYGGVLNAPECVAEGGTWTGTECIGNTPIDDISTQMQVTSITYDGINIESLYTDVNGNGYLDLNDLDAAGEAELTNVVGVTSLDPGETDDMVIEFLFRLEAGNEYQDDYFTLTEIARITKD